MKIFAMLIFLIIIKAIASNVLESFRIAWIIHERINLFMMTLENQDNFSNKKWTLLIILARIIGKY